MTAETLQNTDTKNTNKPLEMLRAAELYCTQGRIAVLDVFLNSDGPLSQNQIAERIGRDKFNKVSIYRTLQSLLKAGLLHRAFVHKRKWFFELSGNCTERYCHPHFTCTGCGCTYCLTNIRVPMVKIPHDQGFTIRRQRTSLEGLCPHCRNIPDCSHKCNTE